MTDKHIAKCRCGKGTASFYIDRDGRHAEITCPDCARKYHVTANGLLPRHIPLKYPKNKLVSRIDTEEWFQRRKTPLYYDEDRRLFMTPDEIDTMFIRTEHGYSSRPSNDDTWQIYHRISLMSELAYLYPKRKLLMLHDAIVDSVNTKEVQDFLSEYDDSKEELVDLLRRTILDYEKHEACQTKWQQKRAERAKELEELYAQLKEFRAGIRKLWETETIPWTALEPL
jgi:hypothetical protein